MPGVEQKTQCVSQGAAVRQKGLLKRSELRDGFYPGFSICGKMILAEVVPGFWADVLRIGPRSGLKRAGRLGEHDRSWKCREVLPPETFQIVLTCSQCLP